MHFAVERRVLEHDLRSNGEQLITRKEARLLIASGYYRESTGSPHAATHFRRSLSDGSLPAPGFGTGVARDCTMTPSIRTPIRCPWGCI